MKLLRSILLTAIAAVGCGGYDAPSEVVLGSNVYTQPAPAADFKPLRTFYLDPLVEVWKDGVQQPSTAVPSGVVASINQRMGSYGYTPAALTAPPDTGLRLAWMQNSYSYYYSYCSGYWYGWYGCWPSWGYAGSYSTGTVVVMMVDLRQAPPPTAPPTDGGQRTVLWVSGLYAVLQGTTIENTSTFNAALNRAFDQSPYLKTSAVP
jgi:hypothetical protein